MRDAESVLSTGSFEALQQQLKDVEEARVVERVQWEARIADAADQVVASNADREV